MPKNKKAKMLASLNQTTKTTSPPKRVKESTIMKWLQNSDLNKNEGSLDIFKAICNENEDEAADSSEEDVEDNNEEQVYKFERVATEQQKQSTELSAKCIDFTSKLRNVEQNLKQLEAEIENRTNSESNYANDEEGDDADGGKGAVKEKGKKQMKKKPKDVYDFDENNDDDEQDESGASAEEDAFIISRNGGDTSEASTSASNIRVLSKHNKKYLLLKSSVNMLREAYNEIKDTVREETMRQNSEGGVASGSSSPPPLVKLQSLSNNATNTNTTSPSRFLDTPESSRASCDDIDLDTDSISEVESISLNSPISSSQSTFKPENNGATASVATNHLLEEQLKEYQLQVGKLNEKLHQTELEAHQTLEIMQVECDDVKHKMLSLNKVIEALREDKKALEQVINENKHNNHKSEKETRMPPPTSPDDVYHEIIETETQRNSNANEDDDIVVVENDLADINVTALEREEELITYKERLEEQQKENIDLRNEIATLKLKAGRSAVAVVAAATTTENLLKRFLPFGFVVLAIIVYFISTYF